MTGKKAIEHRFLKRVERMTQGTTNLLACHLSAKEDHGADAPRSYVKANGREGGDMGKPEWLHEGQVLPDQPCHFL